MLSFKNLSTTLFVKKKKKKAQQKMSNDFIALRVPLSFVQRQMQCLLGSVDTRTRAEYKAIYFVIDTWTISIEIALNIILLKKNQEANPTWHSACCRQRLPVWRLDSCHHYMYIRGNLVQKSVFSVRKSHFFNLVSRPSEEEMHACTLNESGA